MQGRVLGARRRIHVARSALSVSSRVPPVPTSIRRAPLPTAFRIRNSSTGARRLRSAWPATTITSAESRSAIDAWSAEARPSPGPAPSGRQRRCRRPGRVQDPPPGVRPPAPSAPPQMPGLQPSHRRTSPASSAAAGDLYSASPRRPPRGHGRRGCSSEVTQYSARRCRWSRSVRGRTASPRRSTVAAESTRVTCGLADGGDPGRQHSRQWDVLELPRPRPEAGGGGRGGPEPGSVTFPETRSRTAALRSQVMIELATALLRDQLHVARDHPPRGAAA